MTTTKKRFTLAKANKTLPLLTRIVQDIVNTHGRATQIQAKIEEINFCTTPLEKQLLAAREQLQSYVDELSDLGGELKDYETGIVDFPSRHQGRDVYLCWKLGEERIDHWHELHGGITGRQAVSLLAEDEGEER